MQSKIFAVARLTPISQPLAFQAIYRVLFDRESGPKAGNLLAFLDPAFIVKRFQELSYVKAEFWQETAMTTSQLETWLQEKQGEIASVQTHLEEEVIELLVTLTDQKTYMQRVRWSAEGAQADFQTWAREYVEEIETKFLPKT